MSIINERMIRSRRPRPTRSKILLHLHHLLGPNKPGSPDHDQIQTADNGFAKIIPTIPNDVMTAGFIVTIDQAPDQLSCCVEDRECYLVLLGQIKADLGCGIKEVRVVLCSTGINN